MPTRCVRNNPAVAGRGSWALIDLPHDCVTGNEGDAQSDLYRLPDGAVGTEGEGPGVDPELVDQFLGRAAGDRALSRARAPPSGRQSLRRSPGPTVSRSCGNEHKDVAACREAYPNHYIKVNGYHARYTKQTIGLSPS